MVNVAKRVIVLSISILHLALVLASSAGSVTCVDSDGLIKIEASCEQTLVCENQTATAIGPVASDSHRTHDHDDCGDCTDFFLSSFLQVSNQSTRLQSYVRTANIGAVKQMFSIPGFGDLEWLQLDRWTQPPWSTQRVSSLKTTIVIC